MAGDDHDYHECGDKHCDRFPCVVFKEGYADGRSDGYADGYFDGKSDGFADGFAAGAAEAG